MNKYKVSYEKVILNFNFAAATSRGVLQEKTSYILRVTDMDDSEFFAYGEISLIQGLSPDDPEKIENILEKWQNGAENFPSLPQELNLKHLPALAFGIDMVLVSLATQKEMNLPNSSLYFRNDFTENNLALKTNGLIWMSNIKDMKAQIKKKLDAGFSCLKLKVGYETFEQDLKLLAWIRHHFDESIAIRLDANGSFPANEAARALKLFSIYEIEYIEQAIAPKQWVEMAALCKNSPIPLALDEELIDFQGDFLELLKNIQPQYLILKPSILGGVEATLHWIEAAKKTNVEYRITSALESNIGLNAIAQFTAQYADIKAYHGLGTGGLYSNNTASALVLKGENMEFIG